jgi:peptide methionine sulfoxide reductase msrA/msrB
VALCADTATLRVAAKRGGNKQVGCRVYRGCSGGSGEPVPTLNQEKKAVKTGMFACLLVLAAMAMAGACAPDESKADRGRSGKTGADKMQKRVSKSGYDVTPLSKERVAELAKKLDPEAYRITQSAETERPFCGKLLDHKEEGVYACVVCGLPLFSSDHKFKSGTGWPSFYQEYDREHIARRTDRSHGMMRTEINCARCGAHLGHVFDDGPKPTGERHCLNSAAMTFYKKGTEPKPDAMKGDAMTETGKTETAYFAGGCFWGLEHYFQKGPGVIEAVSGYMQGRVENPDYKLVCTDTTGHAETVKVVYDPSKITYRQLLEAFFKMHDPTQMNRQGPDVGAQYRSGLWYVNESQKREAEAYLQELAASKKFGGRKIVTQVEAAKTFYPAEDYHQDYIEKTGRACHVQNPW